MSRRTGPLRLARCAALAIPLWIGAVVCALPGAAIAEWAWIKDELRINLRTGPGVEFRILGALATGDSVEILDRSDGWTQVRSADKGVGWIPAGYLSPEKPARLRLEAREAEGAELRARLDQLAKETAELRSANQELTSNDAGQSQQIEELTRENLELRVGARWPEWIAGASLLSAGMLIGAVLHRNANRRRSSRIRL